MFWFLGQNRKTSCLALSGQKGRKSSQLRSWKKTVFSPDKSVIKTIEPLIFLMIYYLLLIIDYMITTTSINDQRLVNASFSTFSCFWHIFGNLKNFFIDLKCSVRFRRWKPADVEYEVAKAIQTRPGRVINNYLQLHFSFYCHGSDKQLTCCISRPSLIWRRENMKESNLWLVDAKRLDACVNPNI